MIGDSEGVLGASEVGKGVSSGVAVAASGVEVSGGVVCEGKGVNVGDVEGVEEGDKEREGTGVGGRLGVVSVMLEIGDSVYTRPLSVSLLPQAKKYSLTLEGSPVTVICIVTTIPLVSFAPW